jgi:hypothetical protein
MSDWLLAIALIVALGLATYGTRIGGQSGAFALSSAWIRGSRRRWTPCRPL